MTNPERFHLLLTLGGRPAMHGWWGNEATARDQLPTWIGSWGVPGARITLVDEDEQQLLAEWPAEE